MAYMRIWRIASPKVGLWDEAGRVVSTYTGLD